MILFRSAPHKHNRHAHIFAHVELLIKVKLDVMDICRDLIKQFQAHICIGVMSWK
jgi:hypothetical protein